jgi:hypothetical protein
LVLFHASVPVHCAFCIAGIAMSLAPIMFAPSFWFAGSLAATFFVVILGSRLSVATLKDQERALTVFGLVWFTMTVFSCVTFVAGNLLYGLCYGIPSAAVYTLACVTALIPVYLQLSGISPAQRFVSNLTVAATFFASPQWSAMPHNLSSVIMWLALLTGEMVGAHMSCLILSWIRTPSTLRRTILPVALRVARNGVAAAGGTCSADDKTGPAVPDGVNGTFLGEAGPAGPGVNGTAGSSTDIKVPQSKPETDFCKPQPVKEMLRCFVCQPHFHLDALCMHWDTLCFDDPSIETLYAANSLVHSRGMHSIATTAAAAVCVTGIFLSPGFFPLGLLAALWTSLIWNTHQRVQGLRDSPLAYIRFCEAYTRYYFLSGVVFLSLSLVATKAGHDAGAPRSHGVRSGSGAAGSPPVLSGIDLNMSADSPPLLHVIGLALRATSDPIGVACSCLLLMLGGAHHRLVVLPPAQRMTNRLIVLLCVFASHSEDESEQLLPSAAHSFILAACVLLMGELFGFSIDHVRRSLFKDWVLELYAAHRSSLQAATVLESLAANALDLERRNASNMAEMAADKRLNHGTLCGTLE